MRYLSIILLGTLLLILTTACGPRVGVVHERTIQGTPGAPGQDGNNGRDGENGSDGRDGTDGTQVTMVRFCAGQSTVYPTSFPEYGFCIGNVLYGTYWDGHQAWTAAIVPGAYRSTATGLSCNFTVVANCGVAP